MTRAEAERQIILLSAGTAARRDANRGRLTALAAEVDPTSLAESLRARRLLPTLGPRIEEILGAAVDEDFRVRVQRAVEVARRQGAFLEMISDRLAAALTAAGVRSSPLKGPKLSEFLYGDPGRRLAGDIDLLIDPHQLTRAVEVVREFGYGPPQDHVDRHGLPLLHFALSHEKGELPPVELHWRVHWYERSFATDRLLPPSTDRSEDWRPAAVDEGAALFLFYARDGFVDLRLATDIGAWWDRSGGEVGPGGFGELLGCYLDLRHPLLAAAAVAERVVGVPAERTVGTPRRLRLRDRMAVRLANPNPHPDTRRSQIHADMGLVDGLLMPKGDFRSFFKRQVLLPREVLDDQDQKLGRSPRSRLSHGARILTRILFAGTRAVRSPESVL
jgi:Uncharacterised nucleotidyltransferase